MVDLTKGGWLRRMRSCSIFTIAAFACAAVLLFLANSHAFAADVPSVNWTQLTPATSPTARNAPAMAYDPVSKKIVMFGGYSGAAYLNDTWTFDGTNWVKINTATAPPVRTASFMAYDRATRKLVLFGGYNGKYLGDTWLWDGSTMTWTQASPTHSPTAVTGPMLFSDPVNGHVDQFGGFDGMFYQLTTYQWTGSTWTKLHPASSPSARSAAATALNLNNHTVVMFDGLGDVNPYNTWTWDGTTWTEQSPTTQPESLYFAAAIYDPHLRGVIVFGGGNGGVDVNDTWAWTGSNWVKLSPSQAPPPREGAGIAYDPLIGHAVIFGGQDGNNILYNDTWEFQP